MTLLPHSPPASETGLNSVRQGLFLAAASKAGPARTGVAYPGQEGESTMTRFAALLAALVALFVFAPAWAQDASLSLEANQAYLKANANKLGVIVRPSGLQYRIIKNGFGKRPGPQDSVDVNYTGTMINGKVFDKTEPGLPANFVANKLIPGWSEALTLMREVDHWQLVIPSGLGYGTRAIGPIPANQTLVFDLELVKVTPAPKDQDQDQNQGQDQSSQY
jgi:hypothetical protein